VTCDFSRTLGPGVYSLDVQATQYTGKPPCASGVSPIATAQFFVASDPTDDNPPPMVNVQSAAALKLCRQPPGTEYTFTVEFPFTVTTGNGLSTGVTYDVSAFTSNPALYCTVVTSCEYCLHLSCC